MSENCTVEELSNFFHEIGEPYNLGCYEDDTRRWISFCETEYPQKGICMVKKWAVVECEFNEASNAYLCAKGFQPIVLHSNYVIWDSENRWSSGSFASSSLLVSIEENCLFITKSTVYILVGKGHRKSISPKILVALMEGLDVS